MALVRVTNQIVHDPETFKALIAAFPWKCEEIPPTGPSEPLYKIFRVEGPGIPKGDEWIEVRFERSRLSGTPKVQGWQLLDELPGGVQ